MVTVSREEGLGPSTLKAEAGELLSENSLGLIESTGQAGLQSETLF